MSTKTKSKTETKQTTKNDLEKLRLPELWERFQEATGESSRCPNRKFLVRRIEEARATRVVALSARTQGASRSARRNAASQTDREATPDPELTATVADEPPARSEEETSRSARRNAASQADREATPDPEPTATVADEPPARSEDEAPPLARRNARSQAAPEATPEPELEPATPTIVEEPPVRSEEGASHSARRSAPSQAAPEATRAPEPELEPATTTTTSGPPRQRGRFASMTIEELQTKYLDVVGRATGSDDRRYLIWKIRAAEKGRIPVGPRRTRKRAGEPLDVKIIPLRIEADVARRIDEAWRSRGIKSRMEFFRRAFGHYLRHLGADDAAALFPGEGSASA